MLKDLLSIAWVNDLIAILIRSFLAVVIGGIIGSERAKHGRSAGMRTHILVCLGSALTAMTGYYISQYTGTGDAFRISAQVVSGIGFLGAGMIILKNGNTVTGLTTAAGIWSTATIGIALGYGFYAGAIIVTVFFLCSTILLAKIERKNKSFEVIYVELDDVYRVNEIIDNIREKITARFTYRVQPSKTGNTNHVGIDLVFEKRIDFDLKELCQIEGVVYAVEE